MKTKKLIITINVPEFDKVPGDSWPDFWLRFSAVFTKPLAAEIARITGDPKDLNDTSEVRGSHLVLNFSLSLCCVMGCVLYPDGKALIIDCRSSRGEKSKFYYSWESALQVFLDHIHSSLSVRAKGEEVLRKLDQIWGTFEETSIDRPPTVNQISE